MSVFEFQKFFDRRGIHYVTSGNNVKHGNINVKCPWCGPADPSEHLGINVTTGEWGCWRNDQHRGNYPERLLVAVGRLTWDEAKLLVAEGQGTEIGFEALHKRAKKLFSRIVEPPAGLEEIEYLGSISKIRRHGLRSRFFKYLQRRGFDQPEKVAKAYGLRCAMSGSFRQRLIIPLTMNGKLIGWTGRAVGPTSLRYKSHPKGDAVKNLVYGFDDALQGGRVLAVVEGPIDRMKQDWYGRDVDVRAVGTLGANVSDAQVELILRLAPRFDRLVVVPDANLVSAGYKLVCRLAAGRARLWPLPDGLEDPGAMASQQVPLFYRAL